VASGAVDANRCTDWTDGTSGSSGAQGLASAVDGTWLANNSATCNNTARIYCLSQAGSAATAPTLASITPNTGPLPGSTQVVVAGTNFRKGPLVTNGGNACTAPAYSAVVPL